MIAPWGDQRIIGGVFRRGCNAEYSPLHLCLLHEHQCTLSFCSLGSKNSCFDVSTRLSGKVHISVLLPPHMWKHFPPPHRTLTLALSLSLPLALTLALNPAIILTLILTLIITLILALILATPRKIPAQAGVHLS